MGTNHKTVPINHTVLLQGGLASSAVTEQPLIGATNGETLSKTALTVPGGLAGIGELELGGEVTATAELVGPPSSIIVNRLNFAADKPAVTLALKVKLSNPILGEDCYIGTDAEPIVLHLTAGTTSPPSPNEPITGSKGTLVRRDNGEIWTFEGTSLVDNSFAVPGATGCGGEESAVIDTILDLDVGLPAPAGYNTAIMSGSLAEVSASITKKYIHKPTVATGAASSVTATSAVLNATVNPNGEAVSACAFEYGTTTEYGQSVPCSSLPGSGTAPDAVSAAISGLTAKTAYYYRITATSTPGTSTGKDKRLKTS